MDIHSLAHDRAQNLRWTMPGKHTPDTLGNTPDQANLWEHNTKLTRQSCVPVTQHQAHPAKTEFWEHRARHIMLGTLFWNMVPGPNPKSTMPDMRCYAGHTLWDVEFWAQLPSLQNWACKTRQTIPGTDATQNPQCQYSCQELITEQVCHNAGHPKPGTEC